VAARIIPLVAARYRSDLMNEARTKSATAPIVIHTDPQVEPARVISSATAAMYKASVSGAGGCASAIANSAAACAAA